MWPSSGLTVIFDDLSVICDDQIEGMVRFMGCLCYLICQIDAFEEVMEDDGALMIWVVHMDIKIADVQDVTGFIYFLFNYLQ